MQAEILVSHYFPGVLRENTDIDELAEFFAKALWLEKRQYAMFKQAIISALAGEE